MKSGGINFMNALAQRILHWHKNNKYLLSLLNNGYMSKRLNNGEVPVIIKEVTTVLSDR